jgi:hypothetical protein
VQLPPAAPQSGHLAAPESVVAGCSLTMILTGRSLHIDRDFDQPFAVVAFAGR